MLDPAYIRDHMEEVRAGLRNRGVDADKALEVLSELSELAKEVEEELEKARRAGEADANA